MEKSKFKGLVIPWVFGLCLVVLFSYLLINNQIVFEIIDKLKGVLMPFIYGFSIAYLMNPLMSWLEKHMLRKSKNKNNKILRIYSMLLTYTLVLVLFISFFLLIVPQIVVSLNGIITNMPMTMSSIEPWLISKLTPLFERFISDSTQINNILGYITENVKEMVSKLGDLLPLLLSATLALTGIVINILLGIILSVYMLWNKELFIGQFKKSIYAYMPIKKAEKTIIIFRHMHKTVGQFINAKIIDSIIIGILCYIGLLILDIDNELLISLIVGVTNVIPYFGPFIGAIPSVLLIMFANPSDALIFTFFIIILQQFDGNILGPKLLGDSLGLTPFWIIFAVVLTTSLFGVLGMFLGVPFFAVVYTLVREDIRYRVKEKGMSEETQDYI